MKLTLNIEPALIAQIKEVAKKRKTSVSKITEAFFKKELLLDHQPFKMKKENEISDWVKGLVAANEPIADFDHKKAYHEHMEEKYSR